jgi:hypothetical protein
MGVGQGKNDEIPLFSFQYILKMVIKSVTYVSELYLHKGGDYKTAGNHQLSWQAVDGQGNDLPSGMYIIQLKNQQQTSFRKIMLIK